jgi:hypothetical protein
MGIEVPLPQTPSHLTTPSICPLDQVSLRGSQMAHIPANVLIDHRVTSAVSHSSSSTFSSDTLGHQLQTESASHHSSSSYNATGDGANISSDPPALPHGDSTSMSHSGLRHRRDSLASIESSLEDQPEPKVSRSEHRTEVSADHSGK